MMLTRGRLLVAKEEIRTYAKIAVGRFLSGHHADHVNFRLWVYVYGDA